MDKLLTPLEKFDKDLTHLIVKFFDDYNPYEGAPFPAGYLTLFSKTVIYSLFATIPLLFLKVVLPENKIVDWFVYIILLIGGIALLGIFIGILQVFFFSF